MADFTSFYLLRPELLPRGWNEIGKGRGMAVLEEFLALLRQSPDDREALAAARQALERLALKSEDFIRVGEDPRESAANRANDLAFHIVRVQGEVLPLLIHSTLQGFVALLDEAVTGGTDLKPQEWGRLRAAFTVAFSVLARSQIEPGPAQPIVPLRSLAEGERDALRRWTRGHYVFMVLVQALVVILNCFRQSVEAGDIPGARSMLAMATTLMWGSESGLRFAGDFSYNSYEKAVRPTLMPPVAPPGMTGLHWRDHEHLVKVLGGLRPVFQALDPRLEAQREALYEAVATAYESHKYVCSSFVGTERPSLLMNTRTEKSAVELLEHFKGVRLHLVKE